DKVYNVVKMSQDGEIPIRHHTIAEPEVRIVDAKVEKYGETEDLDFESKGKIKPGYKRTRATNLKGVKLTIDPIGYISIAPW
ncbi:MAG: hypothetical protein NZ534_06840, partial [Bacteroidia bacterium]|nr:hypothetical protein [Bacteroidia bacterium]